VVFDVLRRDGADLTSFPYEDRRKELESLELDGQTLTTCERFDDGRALVTAVCELGLEGVVATNRSSLYRPGDRGWVKVKEPNHWRREVEREALSRKHGVGRELASSALRAERHELPGPVAPITPLLGDRGELVDLPRALRTSDRRLVGVPRRHRSTTAAYGSQRHQMNPPGSSVRRRLWGPSKVSGVVGAGGGAVYVVGHFPHERKDRGI
jgi:ATP dependent DNA ligase domain